MEPRLVLDIWDNPSAPIYHPCYSINSWVPELNEAAKMAELVDIRHLRSNRYLYPLLLRLNTYSLKHSIEAWVDALHIYHSVWAQPELAQIPNAVRLGVILHVQGSLDIKLLSYLFGISLHVLASAADTIKHILLRLDLQAPNPSVSECLELLWVYFQFSNEVKDLATDYLDRVVSAAQLIPFGSTSPLQLAGAAVYFAALVYHQAPELAIMAQVSNSPVAEFGDLCDWIWCDPQMEMAAWPLAAHTRYLWYFDQSKNLEAVESVCERHDITDPAVVKQLKHSIIKLPQGMLKRARPFMVLAIMAAIGLNVSETISQQILQASRRTFNQLKTWKALVAKYLAISS